MAVNHMVWMKFGAGVAPDRVAAHLAALKSLAGSVPGVRQLTLGKNFTNRANGYTHGLCVILDDEAALSAYAVHPAHVAVATELRKDAELMAMDYVY